jgi:UDP-N-acetylmuramoyl-tripeptide--D-alanyl-D-alanine ligase
MFDIIYNMQIDKIYDLFINECNKEVCTDTRDIISGSLFFAWRGENINGNKYAEEALNNGALYVVVDDENFYKKDDKRYILTENSQELLAQLAKYHREQFNIPVIAITGSNGKTTTKELISSVLKTEKNIVVTSGNLNNHVGVPKTLLKINKDTEIAVVEMGANHVGEIDYLCSIAKPTYGLITNIGRAHLGLFGGFDGVVRAKSELYRYLEKHKGVSFVNGNDDLLLGLTNTDEKVTYLSTDSNYSVISKKTFPFFSAEWKDNTIKTKLTGEYNIMNISAAIAVGDYFGISFENIKKGIESYVPTNSRSEIIETENNNIVIKDFYNANASSMELALENLSQIKNNKEKIAILGDMFELGDFQEEEHRNVLEKAIIFGIDKIYIIGKIFSSLNIPEDISKNVYIFSNTSDAIFALQKSHIKNSNILLKASNGMNFKKLFDEINW